MNGTSKPYGMIAEFTTAADILHAAQKVRDAGFTRWDVFTPFPVHGMDGAMGMRNSKVGWFSFLGGATGYTSGMLMVWYMNAYDYPIVIGGKPMFSPFYPFVPCFELTILLGAFGAVLGMLFLNRLPRLHHPLLKNRRFAQVTHDKFFLVIECDDPEVFGDRNPQAAGRQPAAGTSSWWRNNALLPCHLCPLRAGHRGRPRLPRQPFPQAAAVYLPGHGAAAQAAAPDGQCLLRQRHEFAPAGGGNDCPQPADPGRRQARLSLAGLAGHHRPRYGHHQLCGDESAAGHRRTAAARANRSSTSTAPPATASWATATARPSASAPWRWWPTCTTSASWS